MHCCLEPLGQHCIGPVMPNGWSYIKNPSDVLKMIRNIDNIPENHILVTADVVGLYPHIT